MPSSACKKKKRISSSLGAALTPELSYTGGPEPGNSQPTRPTRICSSYFVRRLSLHIFFFNYTPTTEIYTLSLHDALPISARGKRINVPVRVDAEIGGYVPVQPLKGRRSEEHTSELQSHHELVCRLLL